MLSYTKIAEDEGGEVLTGGCRPDDPVLADGCYVRPTVVRAKPTDRVCQEEVFGPFVAVTTFRDDDEVIDIANSTEYGLGGGLWTGNLARAHRIAAKMISGMVWINCYKRVNPASPFGGVRSSGYGREMGFEAMREYTQVKVGLGQCRRADSTLLSEVTVMTEILTLKQAIGQFVNDGDTIALEGLPTSSPMPPAMRSFASKRKT